MGGTQGNKENEIRTSILNACLPNFPTKNLWSATGLNRSSGVLSQIPVGGVYRREGQSRLGWAAFKLLGHGMHIFLLVWVEYVTGNWRETWERRRKTILDRKPAGRYWFLFGSVRFYVGKLLRRKFELSFYLFILTLAAIHIIYLHRPPVIEAASACFTLYEARSRHRT